MSLKKICLAAALLALSTTPALAKQGEVCSSATQVNKPEPLSNSTVFQCKAGSMTVPQLYEKGWKVVTTLPQVVMGTDPKTGLPQSSFAWTVVVEHD